jgi:peptide/nickel transport system substrate-binding protein
MGSLSLPPRVTPHAATDVMSATVAANACEPLVHMNASGDHPRPWLATSWATADRRTWTLTLRAGVRFHDGTAFDADAVVANLADLERHGRFDGTAERIGPLAVAIRLGEPNAALLATLSQPFTAMQSPRQLRAADDAPPACTGPYRVAHADGGAIRLEAFAGYWGKAPATARVRYQAFRSEDALDQALRSGRVDVVPSLGPRRAAALRTDPRLTVRSWTGLNVAYLALNNERPPLADRRVRQAIAHALDRPRLVREVLREQGEPARNPLPPGLPGYAARTPPLALDLRRAKRLLEEAGARAPRLVLLAPAEPRTTLPDPALMAERIREDLAAAGVAVEVRMVHDWPDYLRQVTAGHYDLALLGWEADTLDANDFLTALVSRGAIGRTNRSRYASDAMETLLRQARRGASPAERQRTYGDLQRLFQRDMPWVPLFHVSAFLAHRADLRGLELDPTGIVHHAHARRQP